MDFFFREIYYGSFIWKVLWKAKIKEGKRHGRYREYYENGKLKFRGKYANNQPKGTWKYYTEEGEFERKEKHW